MDTKGVVDVPPGPPSPWMLVESTGDSEVDARIGQTSDCGGGDDDDAQSCVLDESEDFDPDCLRELRRRICDGVDEDQKEEKVRLQSQEEVRGCRRNCGGDEQKGIADSVPLKSSASIDSTEEEKNKLFWEACLAS